MLTFDECIQVGRDLAKAELMEGLDQCTKEQQDFFVKMYGPGKHLQVVVNEMEMNKVGRAMEQVAATLKKNLAKKETEEELFTEDRECGDK